MALQQGVFLAANSLARPFEVLLANTIYKAKAAFPILYKVRIGLSAREDLPGLLNEMNIDEATLFPGIDGFARSLRMSAALPRQHQLWMGERTEHELVQPPPLPWQAQPSTRPATEIAPHTGAPPAENETLKN